MCRGALFDLVDGWDGWGQNEFDIISSYERVTNLEGNNRSCAQSYLITSHAPPVIDVFMVIS